MHNPHMIVALGVYIGVLFVAMAIGMSTTMDRSVQLSDSAKQSRVNATIAGGIVGLVVVAAYAATLRAKAGQATFWATLSILFFGLWYAVYMLFPKTYDMTCDGKSQATQDAMIGAHAAALGLGLLAYFLAWKFMK